MGFSILEPTHANVIETIKAGNFGRNEDVYALASFCNSLDKKTSIAIEAPWGSGKTFFIKQTKLLLEAYNPDSQTFTNDEEREIVKTIAENQESHNLDNKHINVYYDAWSNDYDDDPLLSIIYEIVKATGIDYGIKEFSGLQDTVKKLANIFVHDKAVSLLELLEKDDLLSALKEEKDIQKRIEDFIGKVLEEEKSRLIIFIDELDRCNPSFAVRLLERIKHYFTHERVTIIYSVNLVELTHTVRHVYGRDFNADRYLDKFFDWRFSLSNLNVDSKVLWENYHEDESILEQTRDTVVRDFNFSLRETAHYFEILRHGLNNLKEVKIDNEGSSGIFIKSIVLPLAAGLKIKDTRVYNNFIAGRDSEPLSDLISSSNIPDDLLEDINLEILNIYTKPRSVEKLQESLLAMYEDCLANQNLEYSIRRDLQELLQKALSFN